VPTALTRHKKEDEKEIGTVQELDLITPRYGGDESCASEALKQDHEGAEPDKKLNKFQLLNKFFKLRRKNKGAVQLTEEQPHE